MKLQVTNYPTNSVICGIHATDAFPKPGTLSVCRQCGYMLICLPVKQGVDKGAYWDTLEVQERAINSSVDREKAIIWESK